MKLVSLQKIVVFVIIPIALVLAIFSLAKMFDNIHTIELVSEGETSRLLYFENAPLILDAPTKKGHTFDGWYVDENFLFKYNNSSPTRSIRFFAKFNVNQYSITFISYDEVSFHTILEDYNSIFSLPDDPTREGYTFVVYDKSIPETIIDENIIIKAVWQINSYDINFDSNGIAKIDSIKVNFGETITIPQDIKKVGHTFLGWFSNGELFKDTLMPSRDIDLIAQWQINTYTITFDSNGGSEVASIRQDYNTTVTAPANPVREGYTFIRWDSSVTTQNPGAVPKLMPGTDIVLTAQWQINTYKITFNSNGGSEVSSITQDYNTTVTAPANPVREGHTFTGWSSEIPTLMPSANMTLIAQWKINTFEINLNPNGGIISNVTLTRNYNDLLNLPSISKEGHTFLGWYVDSSFVNKLELTRMPAENIELYANWLINSYTITFNSNGGSEVASIRQDYNSTVTSPANPVREGYTFTRWDNTVPTMMPSANITLTAQWQINSYTITFNSNGGLEVSSILQDYNTTVTAPVNPVREGYTFTRWDNTVPTMMPAANITLTAQWQINSYTITFNSNGGSEVSNIRQDYNTTVTALVNPVREGYTFLGWFLDLNSNTPYLLQNMPSTNILLYAKWEINVYTISFDAYDGINIVNFTSNFNESITYPVEPMKNNHGFIGWYLDKDFINAFEMTKVPSEDLNVYARWSILIDRSIIYNNYIYSISFRNSQISMTNNSTNQVEKTISLDGISFPLYAGAKIYENRKLIIDHKSETLMVIGTGKRYQYSYSYFYVVKLDLSLNILSDYTSSHYGGSGIPHAGIRSLNYIEGLFHLTSHYSININQYETFEINKNSFSINPFSNKNFVDISVYSDENLIDGDHDYVRLPTNCFSDCLIYFPTTGINGSDIEWFSTNNNLINPKTGIINISDNASGEVILTAVFRLQNETRTKEFRISLNVD